MSSNDRLAGFNDYYRTHPPDLTCVTDVNHRHFRVVLPSGAFVKIKDRIRSPADLQRWLVRLNARDVYYSTATFLDPTDLRARPGNREGFMRPGNIILTHDIAFDIDRQPLSRLNLERSRRDAVRLLGIMEDWGYPLKYIAFSGSKGFHLVFGDHRWEIIEHPCDREMATIQRRRELVREIGKVGAFGRPGGQGNRETGGTEQSKGAEGNREIGQGGGVRGVWHWGGTRGTGQRWGLRGKLGVLRNRETGGAGIHIDSPVTVDTRRIIRVPRALNSDASF